MKKFSFFQVCVGTLILSTMLLSCGSKKAASYAGYGAMLGSNNSVNINNQLGSSNNYKLVPSSERVSYTLPDPKKPKQKNCLKGLSLADAKQKVLQEAIIEKNCAVIVQPNYSFEMKGKKVRRITVVGYPANYVFPEDDNK